MKRTDKSLLSYSVIVLLEDINPDFSDFILTLHEIFYSRNKPFEILIIANSTEGFLSGELQKLGQVRNQIKAFSFQKKASQAVCLKAGMKESSGEVIIACGSYQQINSSSFIRLLDSLDDQTDIVSPWRKNRIDPFFNQFQSWVFNKMVRKATGHELHDLSCTVRVFRRNVLDHVDLYGNMYRFLPILAADRGFRTREIRCEHYREQGKTGFYSISEYTSRVLDILTLYFLVGFKRKPLRFFISIGAFFFLAGVGIITAVFLQKILCSFPMGDRPILLLSVLLLVVGVQASSVGLLGEIIVFANGRFKKEYSIEKII